MLQQLVNRSCAFLLVNQVMRYHTLIKEERGRSNNVGGFESRQLVMGLVQQPLFYQPTGIVETQVMKNEIRWVVG